VQNDCSVIDKWNPYSSLGIRTNFTIPKIMADSGQPTEIILHEAQSSLIPVSWVGRDAFPLSDLPAEPEEFYHWGEFMAPFDSAAIGLHKVFVDTRIEGWYLLWIGNLVEEWDYKVVAWTPKVNGDSIVKAGYRLFSKVAESIDEFFLDDVFNEVDAEYQKPLFSSERCQEVFSFLKNRD